MYVRMYDIHVYIVCMNVCMYDYVYMYVRRFVCVVAISDILPCKHDIYRHVYTSTRSLIWIRIQIIIYMGEVVLVWI